MKVAIIGAGAAGCFCAVNLKRMLPEAEITVFERASKPMAKLAVTGGGRCNLTNTFQEITHLSQAYPRGGRLMERLFHEFSPEDTCRWWEQEGVPLVTQLDQCIFPRSQRAMQVVDTLLRLMQEGGVRLCTNCRIVSITPDRRILGTAPTDDTPFDAIVITTGGSPRPSGLDFLSPLHLRREPPVPSLFALNIEDAALHELTGIVIDRCSVSIAGTKFQAEGALLITHFGMSGPAILRLSSYAARHLAEQNYRITLSVNWMQGQNEEQVQQILQGFQHTDRQVANLHPSYLTARHWAMLLHRANISENHRWDALNRKEMNRLTAVLTADNYTVTGRRTHKAEFVTCGGVSLQEVNPRTLGLKNHPGIFLAGEVLDIDAITGGFNLQAAWTTAYVVAHSIYQKFIL